MLISDNAVTKGILLPCGSNTYHLKLKDPDESNSIYNIKIRSLDLRPWTLLFELFFEREKKIINWLKTYYNTKNLNALINNILIDFIMGFYFCFESRNKRVAIRADITITCHIPKFCNLNIVAFNHPLWSFLLQLQ